MKELSIEEKAKAYDEAVIRGSRLWESDSITRENYEYIFPELKESEDERIMGNIIATIHLYYGEPLEDEAKEMIAWLEKQGNNMGISEATKQKLEDNLNKALEKETPESFNKFLDEQKPADTEKGAKGNEGDRNRLNHVIKLIDYNIKDGDYCYGHDGRDYLSKNETIDFLKSLKDRYTWKPSEEQMIALDSAIHCYSGISPTNNREVYALEIMKEQLKKLMEE